jgi:WD40 repeat protein
MHVLPGPTRSNKLLAWSPCGRWLATAGTGEGVTVWDTFAGTEGRRILHGTQGAVLLRFLPDSGELFAAMRNGAWTWNPADDSAAPVTLRRGGRVVSDYGIFAFALSGSGRRCAQFVYRNRARQLELYALESGRFDLLHEYPPGEIGVNGLVAFRTEAELFGTLRNRHFGRWTAETGEAVGSVALAPNAVPVQHYVLSPDGTRAAWTTVAALHTSALDDAATNCATAKGASRRGLAWSPCGRVLACGLGTTVQLFEADSLAEIRALDWGIGKPRALAFSPDGARCAVSGDSGRGWVAVFDLD